ncbi:hypothetical protein [Dapis sp. BLCC M229]|uniref:hypothetical protein n=1 Tax=Dapis sp. BLCC M229 TaxID=3400188 RepID=UPI003CF26658
MITIWLFNYADILNPYSNPLIGCNILEAVRSHNSGVRSHNFQGFQLKLTIIKTVTTNLGLLYIYNLRKAIC